MIIPLLLSLLYDQAREPLGQVREVRSRLGLAGEGQQRGLSARLRWVEERHGSKTRMLVTAILVLNGQEEVEQVSRWGTLIPWLAQAARQLFSIPEIVTWDQHACKGSLTSMIRAGRIPDLTRLGLVLDWYHSGQADLRGLSLEEAIEAAEEWHAELTQVPRIEKARPGRLLATGPEWGLPKGWMVQELVSRDQFSDEGNYQQHCLYKAGYWQDYLARKIRVFSIRDPYGEPCWTLTLDLDEDGDIEKIQQCKGKDDITPAEAASKLERRYTRTMLLQSTDEALVAGYAACKHFVPELTSWGSDAIGFLLHEENLKGSPEGYASRGFASVLKNEDVVNMLQDQLDESWNNALFEAWRKAAMADDGVLVGPDVGALILESECPWVKTPRAYVPEYDCSLSCNSFPLFGVIDRAMASRKTGDVLHLQAFLLVWLEGIDSYKPSELWWRPAIVWQAALTHPNGQVSTTARFDEEWPFKPELFMDTRNLTTDEKGRVRGWASLDDDMVKWLLNGAKNEWEDQYAQPRSDGATSIREVVTWVREFLPGEPRKGTRLLQELELFDEYGRLDESWQGEFSPVHWLDLPGREIAYFVKGMTPNLPLQLDLFQRQARLFRPVFAPMFPAPRPSPVPPAAGDEGQQEPLFRGFLKNIR